MVTLQVSGIQEHKSVLYLPSLRKKLHLSQEEAGVRIGGGPRAFQKYESGDVLPSRAISNLLTILAEEPSMLNLLPN